MDLNLFTDMANHHINEWKLPELGWTWGFNQRRRALGVCKHQEKKLYFSTEFILINPTGVMLDTIKHEIAHALVGPNIGHSVIWKRKALEVGAIPKSCAVGNVSPQGRYVAQCCGIIRHFHRRPKYDIRVCTRCNRPVVVRERIGDVSSQARFISQILDGV